jgi:hypothetical protein
MKLVRYFKHLELPKWEIVTEAILQWTLNNTDFISNKKYRGWIPVDTSEIILRVPSIVELFNAAGFNITNISYFIRHNYEPSPPHSHIRDRLARINIPILNCKGTFTKFYTGGEQKLIKNPQGILIKQLVNTDLLKEVACCEIDKPTVLSVDTLHSVTVPINMPVPRVMISVQVDPDPVYMLMEN